MRSLLKNKKSVVGLVSTWTLQMFIQMNGEGIVNTSEGKPGARAPNFPVEEEKKMFNGLVGIGLYTIKNKMFFFKNYPSVISISRMR